MQDGAGRCRTVQDGSGRCRTVQDGAGRCRTVQYGPGWTKGIVGREGIFEVSTRRDAARRAFSSAGCEATQCMVRCRTVHDVVQQAVHIRCSAVQHVSLWCMIGAPRSINGSARCTKDQQRFSTVQHGAARFRRKKVQRGSILSNTARET